jgi:predicted ester cyclase
MARRIVDIEMLNKAVVGRWYKHLWGNPCDISIVDEIATPDVLLQYSDDNPRQGPQAIKEFMAEFREAFPDFEFRRIGSLIADRDIVVARWEGSGLHTGPAYADFHIGPLPAASGRHVVIAGHSAVRLLDGKVAEEAVWPSARKAKLRPITGGLALGLVMPVA